MHFENVSVLVEAVEEMLRAARYCWMDSQVRQGIVLIHTVYFYIRFGMYQFQGVVCRQEGVFRVNCVDCLDRTNVVQTAIARWVLENQVRLQIFGSFKPPRKPLIHFLLAHKTWRGAARQGSAPGYENGLSMVSSTDNLRG